MIPISGLTGSRLMPMALYASGTPSAFSDAER
jgi:hypothetical protein